MVRRRGGGRIDVDLPAHQVNIKHQIATNISFIHIISVESFNHILAFNDFGCLGCDVDVDLFNE